MRHYLITIMTLGLILLSAPAYGQTFTVTTPDIVIPFALTNGQSSTVADNTRIGATHWTMTYYSDSASALSIYFGYATSSTATSWTTWTALDGTATLPATTVPAADITGHGYQPYVRVTASSVTGTGAVVRGTLYGWRTETEDGPNYDSDGRGYVSLLPPLATLYEFATNSTATTEVSIITATTGKSWGITYFNCYNTAMATNPDAAADHAYLKVLEVTSGTPVFYVPCPRAGGSISTLPVDGWKSSTTGVALIIAPSNTDSMLWSIKAYLK